LALAPPVRGLLLVAILVVPLPIGKLQDVGLADDARLTAAVAAAAARLIGRMPSARKRLLEARA
jgi:hypothetical protein